MATPIATAPAAPPSAVPEPVVELRESRRSSFVRSVLGLDGVSHSIGDIARNALLAILLTLVILWPAQLFNLTFEENYDRIRARFERLGRAFGAPGRAIARLASTGFIGFALLTAATAMLYAFLSPDAGWNAGTTALVLGFVAAIAIGTIVGETTEVIYVRRREGNGSYHRMFPAVLVVAAVAVAVSRLVDFQPGYLYGFVAAASFRGELDVTRKGKAALLTATLTLVAGILAWLVWMPVSDLAERAGASFGILVLDAALAGTFVGAIEGLLIALLPMRFLDGAKLLEWKRWAWALLFAATLFTFIHVLLNPASGYVGWSDSVPFVLVASLFGGFLLFSIAFWAWFRYRQPRMA